MRAAVKKARGVAAPKTPPKAKPVAAPKPPPNFKGHAENSAQGSSEDHGARQTAEQGGSHSQDGRGTTAWCSAGSSLGALGSWHWHGPGPYLLLDVKERGQNLHSRAADATDCGQVPNDSAADLLLPERS